MRRPAPGPQELERKGEAFNAERRKATDTILDLQRRLAEAESTAQRLQVRRGRCQLNGVLRCMGMLPALLPAVAAAGQTAAGASGTCLNCASSSWWLCAMPDEQGCAHLPQAEHTRLANKLEAQRAAAEVRRGRLNC